MILLQVGQAGLQSGQNLIEKLSNENISKNCLNYPFNTLDQLCIDTERKVWKKIQKSRGKNSCLFQDRYIDHGVCGRANNWAFGYFGNHENNLGNENKNLEIIMDTYRKMVESVYRYDGVLMLHSLAGGTGSGLGSRLVEEIRQEYGKAPIMTASFAPFSSGETAVQSYNSLLSLSILQEYADFIGYFSNDSLLACVERNQWNEQNKLKTTVNMNSLNDYASSCLMGHLLPLTSVTPSSSGELEFHQNRMANFTPLDFIYNLSPMPSCKYGLFASSLSGGNGDKKSGLDTWDDIFSNMIRNIPILSYNDQISSRICISSHLTLRGVQASGYNLWPRLGKLTDRWQTKIGKSILEHTIDFSYIYGLDVHSQKRSADTCFNSDMIFQHLDPILSKAKKLYENKAYLHCYERFISGNDSKELFGEAFQSLDQVLFDYQSLNMY